MAKKRSRAAIAASRRRRRRAAGETPPFPPGAGTGDIAVGVETTGRFIVVFGEESRDPKSVRATLDAAAGLKAKDIVCSSDFEDGAIASSDVIGGEALHFERLGIVVVSEQEAAAALSAAAGAADSASTIAAIEPEYIAYTTELPMLEYVRGYRDAVNQLYEKLAARGETTVAGEALATFADNAQFTWGLQATRVNTSRRTGQGIRVAVLDTGLDLQHPDFRGRAIQTKEFTGFPVQDIHGHGTHCVGTACGPQRPASGVRRYGVATAAEIFAGKVFNHAQPRPQAPTSSVIAGIEWAVTSRCTVVSLSLGIPIDQQVMQYKEPIRRALRAGTLIVAAAGNNADRPANPGFVEAPANAEAAMAVAAIDSQLQTARFSARSSQITGDGGIVNVAGPGVAVFSSMLNGHSMLNGTSMATPHVAGIAALWAEAEGLAGPALWNRVVQTARPLTLPSTDVGSGLAQAPQ